MATVTGLTANRMIEIEEASVVTGQIIGNDLVLNTRGGTAINAGNVRGPQGVPGPAIAALDDIPNVTVPTPVVGDLLRWNGTAWVSSQPAQQIPTGLISMWSSSIAPSSYLLCDGAAIPAGVQYDPLRMVVGLNTPDLRNRFVIGAKAGDVDLFEIGGAATVTLDETQIPAHDHVATALPHVHTADSVGSPFIREVPGGGEFNIAVGGFGNGARGTYTDDSDVTVTIADAGGGQAHNNMPPYIGLFFIIKI